MDPELAKKIQEQMHKLPLEVQAAVTSPTLRGTLEKIGQKYHLHIDQIGALEDETILVMLALAAPDDFAEQLVRQLGITSEEAGKIMEDVGEEIFVPIRDAMRAFMEKEGVEQEVVSEPPAVAASPVIQSVPKRETDSVPTPTVTVQPTPPVTNLPAISQELHPANIALTQSTASIPKTVDVEQTEPPAPHTETPSNYATADPYREPLL